jgi:hypothetical protein
MKSFHSVVNMIFRCSNQDIDEISAENVTPNVIDLLSVKMTHLSQSVQVSLIKMFCCQD